MTESFSVLIVDRDESWASLIQKELDGSVYVKWIPSVDKLWACLKEQTFNLIVFDITNSKDLEVFFKIRADYPHIPIVVTGEVSENTPSILAKVIKAGAHDFVEKPYTSTRINLSIRNALLVSSMKNEIDYLRREQDIIYDFDKIIARSPSMINVISMLKKFAKVDSTLLITGETGTGKSFLAGAVHFNSSRRLKPFIKVNCANIPDQLLESELFGHERGAFTGAVKTRVGRIEQARGGTVFLDEIGEMSIALQTKLLRFLEERKFERLGSNTTIQVDVRIIVATNRDLLEMVRQGQFREDLYYRLSVLHVHIPPLRERKDCIIPLAYYFLNQRCRLLKRKIVDFSPKALEKLVNYSWPGNVRQLANTIERAIILSDGPILEADAIVLQDIQQTKTNKQKGKSSEIEKERKMILETLEQVGWIQKKAAEVLGLSPRMLNYKIKKYSITHPSWRTHKSN
ncbi:MAG: sigma-54-dependent transcriptional regulator [Thermodesulforhabdaceae bacterium]